MAIVGQSGLLMAAKMAQVIFNFMLFENLKQKYSCDYSSILLILYLRFIRIFSSLVLTIEFFTFCPHFNKQVLQHFG